MRYLAGLVLTLALGVMGCSETSGTGGSGGTAGAGVGGGGAGGVGGGSTGQGFPCTEQGILDAIAEGGGPHTFACDGPTTIRTLEQIVVDNDVVLNGEGNLILDGGDDHRVVNVPSGYQVTLDGITVTRGSIEDGNGGGIATGGQLTLLNSTVSNNVATVTSEFLDRGYGGAIHNTGTLALINCTVSGNSGRRGDGIENRGTVFLNNSTVSEGSGSAILSSAGQVSLEATIIVGQCLDGPGTISNGWNIESPGNTCDFEQSTDMPAMSADDLRLGELADNGGPTQTHALEAGSKAIDVIPAEDCVDADGEPLEFDQRGEPRPVAILGAEPRCDIGAFERQLDDP